MPKKSTQAMSIRKATLFRLDQSLNTNGIEEPNIISNNPIPKIRNPTRLSTELLIFKKFNPVLR